MKTTAEKTRAKNNRTTFVSTEEISVFKKRVIVPADLQGEFLNKTIHGRLEEVASKLPSAFVDLLFIDPPYNLKKTASVYVCCDWKSSLAVYSVLNKYLDVKNRITWEREKGRGALSNWKNCSEDIWFATVSGTYKFNVDAVKLKKKVLAPYKENGIAKDWTEEQNGKYRLTHPSNLWTDITIPFWSMPENTDHSTQKPEKLIAKIILASTEKGDTVLDPFLGSGTTSVVAKKLGRKYVGIEMNEEYCHLAEKRIQKAGENANIQGYSEGVFWERNSLVDQEKGNTGVTDSMSELL